MILEEIFNGKFYPCETVVADSPRFKQAVKASAALMDTLSERLSKEDYALVEELREQVAIAQCDAAEALLANDDVVAAFKQLQLLHDEWRGIGPVAKELREEIGRAHV